MPRSLLIRRVEIMTVQNWWILLCVMAVVNIAIWTVSAVSLTRQNEYFFKAAEHKKQRWMLWLSAAYVAGCAFRSILPRIDLERICLYQSWLSNMILGRSVATVAELCFIAQGALLLHQAGKYTGIRFVSVVSLLLIPIIVVAECASWYAILSTNYLGHVIENSIWTFSAVLLLVSLILLWPHSNRANRHYLMAMIAFAIGYLIFMTNIDVPMYWSRWNADQLAGTQYLSLAKGILDASQACVVDFSMNIWREEIPWMTLYFTAAVWISISLTHIPGWINDSKRVNRILSNSKIID